MKTKKKANLLGVLETPAKKKAISYIRFSTSLQGEKGRDSTRRQAVAVNLAFAAHPQITKCFDFHAPKIPVQPLPRNTNSSEYVLSVNK
jgi:hypothetical protein